MGTAYTGVLVFLTFQGEGSRLCSGSFEFLCVPGSRTYCRACGDFRDRVYGVLSDKLFFSFFPLLVVSLFADSDGALLLASYVIPVDAF
jgi:hypothetical protein